MAKKVTNDDIIKMNELYVTLGTYAAVAREVGFSASTVSKYIKKDYVPLAQREVIKFTDDMFPEEIDVSLFKGLTNFGDVCVLSDEEKDEIEELWKELSV